MRPVYVEAAAAVSPFGAGWRGLSRAPTGTGPSLSVPDLPTGSPKLRKMASRGAELAAFVTQAVLEGVGDRSEIGFWLGVGASGGSVAELEAMLAGSFEDDAFSLDRFAEHGLSQVNPLFAFQLMNNFTLCHAAILSGVGGPNGAFFSRGAGTVHALGEAMYAVQRGDCDRALAGGADSALHPVTRAELRREGFVDSVLSEGAALLRLSARADAPLATVREVRVVPAVDVGAVVDSARADLLVVAACDGRARERLPRGGLDVSLALGDALAATPALAWCAALDALIDRGHGRALVLSLGGDGDLGVVLLERP